MEKIQISIIIPLKIKKFIQSLQTKTISRRNKVQKIKHQLSDSYVLSASEKNMVNN